MEDRVEAGGGPTATTSLADDLETGHDGGVVQVYVTSGQLAGDEVRVGECGWWGEGWGEE